MGNCCWHIWSARMPSEPFFILQLFIPNITDILKFLWLIRFTIFPCSPYFLSYAPLAFPPGLILQVDGKKRGIDCICGQQHLLQANITAAGLFLPLQWRPHCHQEEKVSFVEVVENCQAMHGRVCIWFTWCEFELGLLALLIIHMSWHVECESLTVSLQVFTACEHCMWPRSWVQGV